MNKKVKYSIVIISIITIVSITGLITYKGLFISAIKTNKTIYVKSGTSFDELLIQLKPYLKDLNTFKKVAKLRNFNKPSGGKFVLKTGMSINDLVGRLKTKGEPVKVIFNNQDRLEKLAGRISQQLEIDSISLLEVMKDPNFLKNNSFTEKSVLGMYIPNQYEFYWTDSAEKFRSKIFKYYTSFWNKDRMKKAKKIGLSPQQVTILASIVQKETAKVSERPVVAGLYLNRYKDDWALQADPTIIYALKERDGHDIIIKRVFKKDLEVDSPYNTYKNTGLPPAPISMPDISSIDAVLNYKKHGYFYMCASIEKIGYHNFAKTLDQHNRNAAKYQRWIKEKGIER